jgi:hypothetical protein
VRLSFTSCPLRTFRASSQLSLLVHKWHHAFSYQCKQLDILPFQETELSSSGHVWVDSQTGTTYLSSASLCSYWPSRLHSSAHFCVCQCVYWVRQQLCHLHCRSNTLGFSCAFLICWLSTSRINELINTIKSSVAWSWLWQLVLVSYCWKKLVWLEWNHDKRCLCVYL